MDGANGATQMVVPLPEGLGDYAPIDPVDLFNGLFALPKYSERLLSILMEADANKHYGFDLEFVDLMSVCPQANVLLSTSPEFLLNELDNALVAVQDLVIAGASSLDNDDDIEARVAPFRNTPIRRKAQIHARLCRFPRMLEYVRPNVCAIRAADRGRMVSVPGRVTSVTKRKMVKRKATYRCTNTQCGFTFNLYIRLE